LGQVAALEGNFAEAEIHLTQCLAQAPYPGIQIAAMDRLTYVYADMGDLRRAADYAGASVIAAEKSGIRPGIANALLAEAEVAMAQAHFEEAEKYLGRVGVIAEETGNLYVRVRFLNGKGRLTRLLGQPVEAQQLYRQAFELAESMARQKDAALALVGVGFALLDQEKSEDAATCLRAALEAAWERRIMPEVIGAVVGLAALKGYAGQPQIAERWLRCAVEHPSCPKRVQVEALEIRKRLAIADNTLALEVELLQDIDSALEGVVLELLGP
jgi:tetratricopeptide (TPR) repeat protein